MKVVSDGLSLDPQDPRYEHCQGMASAIETHLASSADHLRQAIVKVLEYQNGDIEEYLILICNVIRLLPAEKIPGGNS